MADSPEEKAHWRAVLNAFDGYMQYHNVIPDATKARQGDLRKAWFREKLDAVDEGIRRNSEFVDEMIADPVFADMLSEPNDHSHQHSHDHSHSHSQDHSHSHSNTTPQNQASSSTSLAKPSQSEVDLAQDKVRSTLRSFVRDWAVEGEAERKACYDPCLDALDRHFPVGEGGRKRSGVKVLVPGSGLGRLAMEVAAKGFSSQANEFSTYMLLASNFILNQTTTPFSNLIFPNIHSFSNHLTTSNHLLRRVLIPDVVPSEVLGEESGEFSMVAGDFVEVYGEDEDQKGQWGGIITCFFIDCARNILTFLRIIYDLLEDDGVWVNLGPLLWHFENSPTTSSKGEGSIELSLDEVKVLAREVGFEIHDQKMVRSTYTGTTEGMLLHEYNAAFWTATKTKRSTVNSISNT